MKRMSIIMLRQLLKKKPHIKIKIPKFLICDCGELMILNHSKEFFHCRCGYEFWLPKRAEIVDDLERVAVIIK